MARDQSRPERSASPPSSSSSSSSSPIRPSRKRARVGARGVGREHIEDSEDDDDDVQVEELTAQAAGPSVQQQAEHDSSDDELLQDPSDEALLRDPSDEALVQDAADEALLQDLAPSGFRPRRPRRRIDYTSSSSNGSDDGEAMFLGGYEDDDGGADDEDFSPDELEDLDMLEGLREPAEEMEPDELEDEDLEHHLSAPTPAPTTSFINVKPRTLEEYRMILKPLHTVLSICRGVPPLSIHALIVQDNLQLRLPELRATILCIAILGGVMHRTHCRALLKVNHRMLRDPNAVPVIRLPSKPTPVARKVAKKGGFVVKHKTITGYWLRVNRVLAAYGNKGIPREWREELGIWRRDLRLSKEPPIDPSTIKVDPTILSQDRELSPEPVVPPAKGKARGRPRAAPRFQMGTVAPPDSFKPTTLQESMDELPDPAKALRMTIAFTCPLCELDCKTYPQLLFHWIIAACKWPVDKKRAGGQRKDRRAAGVIADDNGVGGEGIGTNGNQGEGDNNDNEGEGINTSGDNGDGINTSGDNGDGINTMDTAGDGNNTNDNEGESTNSNDTRTDGNTNDNDDNTNDNHNDGNTHDNLEAPQSTVIHKVSATPPTVTAQHDNDSCHPVNSSQDDGNLSATGQGTQQDGGENSNADREAENSSNIIPLTDGTGDSTMTDSAVIDAADETHAASSSTDIAAPDDNATASSSAATAPTTTTDRVWCAFCHCFYPTRGINKEVVAKHKDDCAYAWGIRSGYSQAINNGSLLRSKGARKRPKKNTGVFPQALHADLYRPCAFTVPNFFALKAPATNATMSITWYFCPDCSGGRKPMPEKGKPRKAQLNPKKMYAIFRTTTALAQHYVDHILVGGGRLGEKRMPVIQEYDPPWTCTYPACQFVAEDMHERVCHLSKEHMMPLLVDIKGRAVRQGTLREDRQVEWWNIDHAIALEFHSDTLYLTKGKTDMQRGRRAVKEAVAAMAPSIHPSDEDAEGTTDSEVDWDEVLSE